MKYVLVIFLIFINTCWGQPSQHSSQQRLYQQRISRPDSSIVFTINTLTDQQKEVLYNYGYLTKKKIGKIEYYQIELVTYYSFPPSAELYWVYQSGGALIWVGGRDIIATNTKGDEICPDTTIINVWQLGKPEKVQQRVYKGGLPIVANKGSTLVIIKRNAELAKIKAKKEKQEKNNNKFFDIKVGFEK